MSFSPSSPVTGAAVTGLTSPTYTLTADTAPAPQAKQYYVSALGGTQTGVTTHSVNSPFIVSMWRPIALVAAAFFSALTGFRQKNGTNKYKVVFLKGTTPVTGSVPQNMQVTVAMEIPAGSETNDAANVKACLSLVGGVLWATASGIADTTGTGTL